LTVVLLINSMHCGENTFGDRVAEKGLWPLLSPDLNPCDFYFSGMFKNKCIYNPRSKDPVRL